MFPGRQTNIRVLKRGPKSQVADGVSVLTVRVQVSFLLYIVGL